MNPSETPLSVVRAILDRVLDAAFPARCAGCGREGPPLCRSCLPALDARLDLPAGVPLGLPAEIPVPLLQLEWCAPFRGIVRDALHRLKYAGERRLAEPLGMAAARRWERAGVGADLVMHVPVHAERARARGYDQAELVARVAARHLDLPFAAGLVRVRATTAQFDLDRADRAANVAGAFAIAGAGSSRVGDGRVRPGADVRGRWVLLVDDVMTTGATLAACAGVLEAAGAMAVSAVTIARER
ncbi:MAG: phosphoribosyltransferase family protein [Chloroflexota bacterium]|nr:phosphoribosyltransferase family protein [Chloroflexota bacterium]